MTLTGHSGVFQVTPISVKVFAIEQQRAGSALTYAYFVRHVAGKLMFSGIHSNAQIAHGA